MPSKEILVLQIDTTKLCDRNSKRTVLMITNEGINGATRINIQDEAKQVWMFILTQRYETLILKAADGFDVTHEWYAYATGADEWVNIFEEALPNDIAAELEAKGIKSTSGINLGALLLLLGAS